MDYGKLNFSTSFNPTSAFPLDAREYFDSLDEARLAAQSAKEVGSTESIYYIGQTLVVVEDGQSVLYVIQPDLSLKRVGADGAIASSGADMGQHDPSHPAYVKNKTHYDSRASAHFSALEDPVPISFNLFNQKWYKMCDLTPSIEQILQAKWTFNGSDIIFAEEHILSHAYNNKDELTAITLSNNSYFVVVIYEATEMTCNFNSQSVTFTPPSIGIFRAISSYVDQTFDIEYGELQKIADKYLPEDILRQSALGKTIATLDENGKIPESQLPEQKIDDAPTKDSKNPVSSGGVHQALETMQSTIDKSLQDKADQSAIDKSLEELGKAIEDKADQSTVGAIQESLKDMVDKSAIESLQKTIDDKADKSAVEGLQKDLADKASKSDITSIQQTLGSKANQSDVDKKADKDKVYSKEEIDGKLSGIYHYKGSVGTYNDLPKEGMQVGDAYNIQVADESNGIKAGDNVAWDGEKWDILSGIVDLSAYAKKSDLDSLVQIDKFNELNKALENKVDQSTLEESLKDKVTEADLEESLKDKVTEDALEEALGDKVDKDILGKANGVATLDESGKVPASQLPAFIPSTGTTSSPDTIIHTIFDEDNGVYKIDEESAELLQGYTGETAMYLYEPLGKLYIPYVGNNEFVIDVFGASIYFRVDVDTLLCEVSVGEWASLDENGEISEDKIPNILLHGFYVPEEGVFYEDEEHQILLQGNYKKFYVDITKGTLYYYSGGTYYPISGKADSVDVEYISDEDYESLLEELGI